MLIQQVKAALLTARAVQLLVNNEKLTNLAVYTEFQWLSIST